MYIDFRPLNPWSYYPQIGLYLDQVLGLSELELSAFTRPGEATLLTAAMINNYVKRGLIPPPHKKKYETAQVTRLIMASLLKQSLSIDEVQRLLELGDRVYEYNAEQVYETFRLALESIVNPLTEVKVAARGDGETEAVLFDYALRSALTGFISGLEASLCLQQCSSAPGTSQK